MYVSAERVRHRLVGADRTAELLARLGMLHRDVEHVARDPRRFQRHRSEPLRFLCMRIEQLVAAIRTPGFFVHDRAVEKAEVGELVAIPAAAGRGRGLPLAATAPAPR
jgi:predicted alpha/beta hydrolase